MKLHQLPKTTARKNKRLGRGYASGKGGHTVGRGQKGQRSRSKLPTWFEGGQLPLIRRLPFIRGKNRFKSLKSPTIEINLDKLSAFKSGQTIDAQSLAKAGIIKPSEVNSPIKILGTGTLKISLTVNLPTSQLAAEKITKAGGQVTAQLNSDQ